MCILLGSISNTTTHQFVQIINRCFFTDLNLSMVLYKFKIFCNYFEALKIQEKYLANTYAPINFYWIFWYSFTTPKSLDSITNIWAWKTFQNFSKTFRTIISSNTSRNLLFIYGLLWILSSTKYFIEIFFTEFFLQQGSSKSFLTAQNLKLFVKK